MVRQQVRPSGGLALFCLSRFSPQTAGPTAPNPAVRKQRKASKKKRKKSLKKTQHRQTSHFRVNLLKMMQRPLEADRVTPASGRRKKDHGHDSPSDHLVDAAGQSDAGTQHIPAAGVPASQENEQGELARALGESSPPAPPACETALSVVSVAFEFPPQAPPTISPDRFLTTQELLRPDAHLSQSIEAFLLDQRSPHTRMAYGKDLKRFIQFLLVKRFTQGVSQINRALLISYKEFLLSEKLQHTTVDRHIATLKSFFKWLTEDGHLEKSPADGVRYMSPKRLSSTNGFSDEEVKKILAVPDLHTRVGALHYVILMILFYCGLRRSELCELKMSSLGTERKQRVIRLRGKGNAERMIVLIPQVWNAIQFYFHITSRKYKADAPLLAPLINNRSKVINRHLDPSSIFYVVRKYAKRAGVSNRVSPHSCRATAISNARDHHVPDRAIQEFAGWVSPEMITRYDKRKTSVEDSAAHSIHYGSAAQKMPDLSSWDLSQTQLLLFSSDATPSKPSSTPKTTPSAAADAGLGNLGFELGAEEGVGLSRAKSQKPLEKD